MCVVLLTFHVHYNFLSLDTYGELPWTYDFLQCCGSLCDGLEIVGYVPEGTERILLSKLSFTWIIYCSNNFPK